MNYPVEVDMDWMNALGAVIAVGCLAGCAGYESADVEVDVEAAPEEIPDVAPETDPEQYRISVEIPVDDVTIDRGENLDVDAMLDERTAFAAADFHLREVVLIARSRRGGSAELVIDEWASGAVDIPQGTAESWFEVRIPAADVGEAGVDWVVDFTGALDLNLLVAVLEPRTELLAEATATVREVVVEDPAEAAVEALAAPSVEVVQAVEVVEPIPTQTVVKEVAVVEQPVYRTKTVYRYVDRPVYSYRVSWIYDPARYYVFRDYGGWTYRYFPGTWDWRCYDLSFRLPSRHHHHDRHRHRADRHDGRRHDGRRYDGRRYDRRDRGRRGSRSQGSESRAVVSRPDALWRRVDPGHPRLQLATQRRAEPRVEEGRRTNPRLRTERRGQPRNTAQAANRPDQPVERATNPRMNPFQRRSSSGSTRPAAEANAGRSAVAGIPPASARSARTRTFQRRPEQQVPERQVSPSVRSASPTERRSSLPSRTASPRTTTPRLRTRAPEGSSQDRGDPGRSNVRTRTFQRPADRPTAAQVREDSSRSNVRTRTFQRQADPDAVRSGRRAVESGRAAPRVSTPSNVDRRRSADTARSNVRTRTFQRRPTPREVEPPRPRAERQRPRTQTQPSQSRPRFSTRSTPPRQTSSPASRPQRAAPTVQRPPAKPQSDSGSDARPDESRRSNGRTRAFERR